MSHQPRRGVRWFYLIPALIVVGGLSFLAYFGWDYAQQTVWLSRQNLAVYHPSQNVKMKVQELIWTPKPALGEMIGEISFPRIGVNVPVVEGADTTQLRHGAGHDLRSALPGQGSNVFIAGHRDTVFAKVRDLHVGDMVSLQTPYGTFTYRVTRFQVVSEHNVSVLAPSATETLTISTCYPFDYFGPAPDRYIVYTQLVSEPSLSAVQTVQS